MPQASWRAALAWGCMGGGALRVLRPQWSRLSSAAQPAHVEVRCLLRPVDINWVYFT